MSIRVLRKALGLLIVDLIIIIGIFVLQFRTVSSIIQKIGNLQVTLEENSEESEKTSLKNYLRISYNGFNVFFDDQNTASIKKGGLVIPLKLISWEKRDELSFKFNFTDGVVLIASLDSENPNSDFSMHAVLPNGVTDLIIPYSYASGMKVQKSDSNKIILDSRKNSWEISAYSLEDNHINLTSKNSFVSYSVYDNEQKFSFDSIIELPLAEPSAYGATISSLKANIISSFIVNATTESNISEQVLVSYLAAQADNGNYSSALEYVPVALRKGRQRTYLSAPYFGSLAEMSVELEKTVADYERQITRASENGNLDIFTVRDIASFMYVHSDREKVKALLSSVASQNVSEASIAQVTGILKVYDDLVALDDELAYLLKPAINGCIDKITEACSLQNNVLTISENETFLSVIQAIETATAIMRYGNITANQTFTKAGYVLINSYLAEISSFDLRTLCNIYAILSFDNKFYPHFQKISDDGTKKIYAWTCATDITGKKEGNSLTLTIDFPENWTHYVMFKGIPKFSTIYIYNMAFRTDPRFETYNSSGYVYKHEEEILLLKSRHKSKLETVRFDLGQAAAPKPVSPVTQPASAENGTASENTAATEAAENSEANNNQNLTANENADNNRPTGYYYANKYVNE